MFKTLENSLISTQSTKFLFGKFFLICICGCADIIDKVSYKIPLKEKELNKLIHDVKLFKSMSYKVGETYVDNFFRDDFVTNEEFTLFVRLTVNYPYSTRTDKEIQLNITGPDKATALLRYYYIASTVERYIYETKSRVWFYFNPINIKDITRADLIKIYQAGMPDSQQDDKAIREQLLKVFNKTCFTASIPVNQNQIVYNVAKTPWTWLYARHIKK